ncbi:hypothetical protein ACSTJV_24085, partial [Vibrio parahaemolyticus]
RFVYARVRNIYRDLMLLSLSFDCLVFRPWKRTTTSTMEWEMLQTDFLYIGMLLICGLSMWAFIALCSRLERQEGEKK